MGRRPEKYPKYLGGGGDKDKKNINFEYIMWHHIDLTVKYVIASFHADEKRQGELVGLLVKQFDEWGEGLSNHPALQDADKTPPPSGMVSSDFPEGPISYWKEGLILQHTLAAKAIADSTWDFARASAKIDGLVKIAGENRNKIKAFWGDKEAAQLWDAHLACTADYISALHLTTDANGPVFGRAVFICKLLGLEFGGFMNQKIYDVDFCGK